MNGERSEKQTVLVVDDKAENLRILIDYLNRAGFEALVAQDGEGAIRQMEYALPDIVLLDILMPGIDGYETCIRLKKNETTRDIPVIFMSALSDTVDKIRGFEVGAVDYITKPFRHEEVLARINTHLTIRRQKEELSRLNAGLAESNAAKDKFFSIISHDLRGHFGTLIGGTDVLIRCFDNLSAEERTHILRGIHTASNDAYRLLSNLLEWSRNQTNRIKCEPMKIDLRAIAETNLGLFRQAATEKQIALINDIRENVFIYADEPMTNTVMRNLISNAVKFAYIGGTVGIGSKSMGEMVEISVSDTGIGMKEEDISKLFRTDVHHTVRGTAEEYGTGLGLILCKDFVEKNGGKIWAKSVEGKESCFYFTLPEARK